jgi:Tfp pilus assembly protein PilF
MKSKQFLNYCVIVTTLMCTLFILPVHLLAQKGEMPITTSSKEALKLFSAGVDKMENIERAVAAILFDQAIKKDPEFALAYLYRAHAGGGSKVFHQNIEKRKIYIRPVDQ